MWCLDSYDECLWQIHLNSLFRSRCLPERKPNQVEGFVTDLRKAKAIQRSQNYREFDSCIMEKKTVVWPKYVTTEDGHWTHHFYTVPDCLSLLGLSNASYNSYFHGWGIIRNYI